MLDCVFFDLMDTVLIDPYEEALVAATGLGVAELHELRDPTAWADFELARIDEPEFARRFFADGSPFDSVTFNRVRRAGYRWVPGMREIVEELEGRVQRHVASNYPEWIDEVRSQFTLHEHFEGIWASVHLGARKPDPAFYRRLAECADVEPRRCLFVDDRPRNCEGAVSAGMRSHVFTGAAALRECLLAEGALSDASEGGEPGSRERGKSA